MTEQAKPTPGPWHVYGRTNGLQIAVVGPSNSREESITYVWGQNGEAEANARLIAEAGTVHHEIGLTPRQLAEQRAELLEALEEAVSLYGKPGGPWNVLEGPGAWITKARAAIAKARGGSDD